MNAISHCQGGQCGCPMCEQERGVGVKGVTHAFPKSFFPGTASMFASEHKLAVTTEWMRGWNACLDEIGRNGGFTRNPEGQSK